MLIFAFQAENLTSRFLHVVLIAVPILIQVYFNSSLAYGLMKLLRVPHGVAAPGALIGASNFFELAVATAIALYGPDSGAALATVVGVLVEVPVMLSVCALLQPDAALVPRGRRGRGGPGSRSRGRRRTLIRHSRCTRGRRRGVGSGEWLALLFSRSRGGIHLEGVEPAGPGRCGSA